MCGIIFRSILFAAFVANCFNQETEEVTPDLFPYQALVSGYYYCSGALITVQHVITTAHCANGTDEADVYLGFYGYPYYEDNRNEEQGQIIQSKEIIIHDNYMQISNKQFQDVAIVVLSKPAEITLYVQPIDLSTETPSLGAYAKLSGWNAREDNNLQYYPVELYDTDICIYIYGSAFLQSQLLCFQKLTTASLDLVGNPLSVNNKLVGLVTNNINCMSYITDCITDNIVINLTQFLPWIHQQIGTEINIPNSNYSNIDNFKTDKPQVTHIKELRNILPDSTDQRMIDNNNQSN
ncbi:brachyurin-like [Rhynchophorus ferrugineus]|uniref:brachyurin-like n=1 Tax=Rhynchophorus ferrugineus TaxID=354439 RepID=UPI003FCC8538